MNQEQKTHPIKSLYELPGSKELLLEVRGRFIQRGETLSAWCEENGISLPNARKYLRGDRDEPPAHSALSIPGVLPGRHGA